MQLHSNKAHHHTTVHNGKSSQPDVSEADAESKEEEEIIAHCHLLVDASEPSKLSVDLS